jgi:integrase
VTSVNTGMRLTEHYTCTWGQVDLERRAIRLTETKNGSARTVHLNADAVAAIDSLRISGQKSADRLFPREGENFGTRSWFHPCMEEAGIQGYVWHSNRHTFCSWLAMAGATIKEIQELAGHKIISIVRPVCPPLTRSQTQCHRANSRNSHPPPAQAGQLQGKPTATKTATTKKLAI